ncbi:hypothetical protein LIER_10730 [Lithospermum erythrorhizon]|uniref:SBP-type domain-containing protein n=1 Tax=Lithospermum erythrorhizon TaxID=34254 RepID=A0AAV3PKF5_LITER
MEATVGAEAHLFYGANSGNFRGLGDRTLEWDPNRWKWDGDLFIATPINLDSGPSNYQSKQFFPLENRIPLAGAASNSSSSCSDELSLGAGKDRREVERKRRVVTDDDDVRNVEGGSLTLNLGGNGNPTIGSDQINGDGTSGKKAKIGGVTSSRAVCQVDGCKIDLSKAKDYHRRHKVCETHSKASEALVGNVMQRFCQQCSRFHALQEFDEGKRSCRRQLAGHNKRRRKTQPDSASNNMNSVNDNHASGYLLMSLLKILSNLHSSRVSGANDENLLSHLLRSLAAQGSLDGDKNLSQLIQSANSPAGTKYRTGQAVHSNGHQIPPRPKPQNSSVVAAEMPQRVSHSHNAIVENLHTSSQNPGKIIPTAVSSLTCEVGNGPAERTKLNNFDLNDVYIDSDDGIEDAERFPVSTEIGTGSPGYPSWTQQDSLQSSPPQTSGTSGSASAQSPSSSNGEAQSRTDRIVFKLFGRDPNDFPLVLKAQILDWLAHSPTDIESYIRPGCIILTLFLRLPESKWEELSCDLRSSLSKLLDIAYDDVFWTNGWIYTRVQNRIAFAHNGRIVMDTSLSFRRNEHSTILSIKPIAVPVSETTRFFIKGTNLSRTSTSFLCALEGQYLMVEANYESNDPEENVEHDEIQCLKLSCSLPAFSGRGFIEVEDHGLSSSFFPFIVAEKDICSEISSLESVIDIKKIDNVHDDINKIESRNQALDFIHEMGWLLHRNNLRSRLNNLDPTSDLFPFKRYKWLMEFAVEHEWCAVVCKLLDVLLKGRIGGGDYPFLKYALSELGLLHRAVRRNSKSLVELLQRYTPQGVAEELSLECKSLVGDGGFLFRPDFRGPGGLTPLHVAAGRDGSEDVLDVLTNDPGEVGIEAWKNSRDRTGSTPEDYARLRGHYSYIHLVQRKINKRAPTGHVVVDVPVTISEGTINIKQDEVASTAFDITGAQLRSMQRPCGLCVQKVAFGYNRRSFLYRPAMLSMVAIAAVCVCVALLFKSSPEVLYVFRPFRWETLEYGTS